MRARTGRWRISCVAAASSKREGTAAMDALRGGCATGMMQESLESNPLATNPIPAVVMDGEAFETNSIAPDGDCLFDSLLHLYKYALKLDPALEVRVDHSVRTLFDQRLSPEPFKLQTKRVMRRILAQLVHEGWGHYYKNPAFKKELLDTARKLVPNLRDDDSDGIKRAYRTQMGTNGFWGTFVELDAACELFGVAIESWYKDPNVARGKFYRTHRFTPTGTRPHNAGIEWTWRLAHVGFVHFEWIKPWPVTKPTAAPSRAREVAKAHDAQADAIMPGAASVLRRAAAKFGGWNFATFKQWASKNFPVALLANEILASLYAGYQFYGRQSEHAKASWNAASDDAWGDAWIEPGIWLGGSTTTMALPKGASVVDRAFAKAEARKLRLAQ